MTAPAELVARWEAAYGEYTQASTWVQRAPRDPEAMQAVARTSWEVAELWRALADLPELAWWLVAGLHTAANALEVQAHQWHDHVLEPPIRPRLYVQRGH